MPENQGKPRYEYCKTLTNRVGCLKTREELEGLHGFRSVYGFSEASCAYFQELRAVKNSRGMVVYCDELLVDIDDDIPSAEALFVRLSDLGLGFETWESGGRSIHFHIPHAPVWSADLPYSHRELIRSWGAKVDESIYQAGRIFRLPGTVHAKTGNRKVLLKAVEGKLLEVPILPTPQRNLSFGGVADGEGLGEFSIILERVARNPPQEGERNRKLYALACSVFSCGFSADFVEELLEKVNEELMEDSIDENEMSLLLHSATSAFGG